MKTIMHKNILFAFALSAMFSIAQATTVLYRDFNQLVDNSDHAMGGTIAAIDYIETDNGEAYTTLTFDNAYTVGAGGMRGLVEPAKIRFRGGKTNLYDKEGNVNGYDLMEIAGTPKFNVGEKMLMFVKDNGKSVMPIYGFGQGLYRVDDSEYIRNSHGYTIAGFTGAQGADVMTIKEGNVIVKGKVLSPASTASGMTLSALRDKIQQRKALRQQQRKTTAAQQDITSLTALPPLPTAAAKPDVPASTVRMLEKKPARVDGEFK